MLTKYPKISRFHYLTYPAITPVITSGTTESPNAMAASWCTPLSVRPPLYGVSVAPKRYTYKLIRKYRDFGVCFLPFSMVDKVLGVGSVSGVEINKFERYGLGVKRAEKINAPLIEESISALECKLVNSFEVGDHVFFVGEVVCVWVDEDLLSDIILDPKKAKHVFYLGNGYFTTNSDEIIAPK